MKSRNENMKVLTLSAVLALAALGFSAPRNLPNTARVYQVKLELMQTVKSSANVTVSMLSVGRRACCFGFLRQSGVPSVVLIHPPQAETRTVMFIQ
ncbi:hypothetical protein BDDG_11631 [Blastomyces dermatitidis ATCC 18188]|uniref:Uncharacterized protein n=1 Tax=Ajellomyces dermatitidis (strain ATCC 18188 / CBS 674.68) TaxID=653446 RepID=A0A0J9EKG4_AJEDA|nr:hypothetical protein BDDG_11631 [Blastomyces dermatitidis ATCC 18188]